MDANGWSHLAAGLLLQPDSLDHGYEKYVLDMGTLEGQGAITPKICMDRPHGIPP